MELTAAKTDAIVKKIKQCDHIDIHPIFQKESKEAGWEVICGHSVTIDDIQEGHHEGIQVTIFNSDLDKTTVGYKFFDHGTMMRFSREELGHIKY